MNPIPVKEAEEIFKTWLNSYIVTNVTVIDNELTIELDGGRLKLRFIGTASNFGYEQGMIDFWQEGQETIGWWT